MDTGAWLGHNIWCGWDQYPTDTVHRHPILPATWLLFLLEYSCCCSLCISVILVLHQEPPRGSIRHIKTKKPSPHQGRRQSPRYHPACPVEIKPEPLINALTGAPGTGYLNFTDAADFPGYGKPAGEFNLVRSARHIVGLSPRSPNSLTDDLLLLLLPLSVDPGGFEPPAFSMPLRRAPNCAMGPGHAISVVKFCGVIHPRWT